MKFIDTHTHIYLPEEFDGANSQVARRAFDANVCHLIMPNVDKTTIEPMMQLHAEFPSATSMAIGLHPTEINDNWKEDLNHIYHTLKNHKFVAIGEVGIDMYWDKTFRLQQMEALDIQMHWAEEANLPVIIHCRDGLNEIIDILSSYSGEIPTLIFHSFTGSKEDVATLRQYGDFYFGINGVVTFKNAAQIRDALPYIGLDRLLLETDSPYLAPVPYRGKRNESAFLPVVATKIAETLHISTEEVAQATTLSATKIFNLNI